MPRKYVKWTILGIIGAILLWDLMLATDVVSRNTISEIITDYARQYFIIPGAFGLVLGHWFWPRSWEKGETPLGITVGLILALGGMLVLSFTIVCPMIIPLGIGFCLGHLLWPNSSSND